MDSFEALRILGVRVDAPLSEIRRAFIDEARKAHPDSGTAPDESRMAQLNVAFQYLSKMRTEDEDSIGWSDSVPPDPTAGWSARPGGSSDPSPRPTPQWVGSYGTQERRPSIVERIWSNGLGRIALIIAAIAVLSGIVDALGTDDEERIVAQNQAATRATATTGMPISAGSTRSVFDLRVGDCIATVSDGAFSTVRVVLCSSSLAQFRVTRLIALPNATSLPSQATLATYEARCPSGSVTTFRPTAESWSAGDRTLTCLSRP